MWPFGTPLEPVVCIFCAEYDPLPRISSSMGILFNKRDLRLATPFVACLILLQSRKKGAIAIALRPAAPADLALVRHEPEPLRALLEVPSRVQT